MVWRQPRLGAICAALARFMRFIDVERPCAGVGPLIHRV
jgi:hypothetical protein